MQAVIQFLPLALPGAVLSHGGKVPKGHKEGGQPPSLMNPPDYGRTFIDRT